MKNVFIVHCHHSHDDVGEGAKDLFGGKTRARLDSSLYELVEIAFRAVFHDDEYTVSVSEILVELDNSRALQHLQECNLSVSGLLIFSVHVIQVDFLKRILLRINHVLIE